MREFAILTTAAASLVASASCASASNSARCPSDRTCGESHWYASTGTGASVEGRVFTAPVTGVAGAADDGSEAMTLGAQPVLLRFDLHGVRTGSIERAVLTLAPHASWRPSGPTRIHVRGVEGAWIIGGSTPPLSNELAAEVYLPGTARTVLRVDVTGAIHQLGEGQYTVDAIALDAEGAPATFTGYAASTVAERPRLEVLVR